MPHDVALPANPGRAEPGAAGGRLRRLLLPPPGGVAKRLVYAVLGVPLAALYALLFAGLFASALLTIYGVGVVTILVLLMVVRGVGAWERAMSRRFAGLDVAGGLALRRERGLVRRLRLLITSGSTWRTLAWLGVRVLVSAAVVAALFFGGAAVAVLLTYPDSLGLPRNLVLDLVVLVLASSCILVLVRLLDLSGRGLAVVAPTLLGAAAEERIAAMRRASVRVAGRTAVARDLHDTIGHTLTASLVQAEAAQRALRALDGEGSGPRDLEFARQALGHIEHNTRQALTELDRALAVLGNPPRVGELVEQPPDLRDAEALLAGLRDAGLPVTLTVGTAGGVSDGELTGEASRLAYRVIQEGTTNVLRHAGLAPTLIEVEQTGGRLLVGVRNVAGPRIGAAPGRNGGHGLTGLRQRAEELGGSLRAGPTPDKGFELVVELPVGASRG